MVDVGFEPTNPMGADLKSAAFDHSANLPNNIKVPKKYIIKKNYNINSTRTLVYITMYPFIRGSKRLFSDSKSILSVDDLIAPFIQSIRPSSESPIDGKVFLNSLRGSVLTRRLRPGSSYSKRCDPDDRTNTHFYPNFSSPGLHKDRSISLIDRQPVNSSKKKKKSTKPSVNLEETNDIEILKARTGVKFESMQQLPMWLKNSLSNRGLIVATPIQAKLIDCLSDPQGPNLISRGHTGTGKSFGYILALLSRLHLYRFRANPSPYRSCRLPGLEKGSMWEPLNIVLVPNAILGLQLFKWVREFLAGNQHYLNSLQTIVRIILPTSQVDYLESSDGDHFEQCPAVSDFVSSSEMNKINHDSDCNESKGFSSNENTRINILKQLKECQKPGRSYMLIATPSKLHAALSAGKLLTRQIQLLVLDEADHLLRPLSLYAQFKQVKNRKKHPMETLSFLRDLKNVRLNGQLLMPRICLTSASLSRQCAIDLGREGLLNLKKCALIKETMSCPSLIQHRHRLVEDAFELVSIVAAVIHENRNKNDGRSGVIFLDGTQSKTEFIQMLKEAGVEGFKLMGKSETEISVIGANNSSDFSNPSPTDRLNQLNMNESEIKIKETDSIDYLKARSSEIPSKIDQAFSTGAKVRADFANGFTDINCTHQNDNSLLISQYSEEKCKENHSSTKPSNDESLNYEMSLEVLKDELQALRPVINNESSSRPKTNNRRVDFSINKASKTCDLSNKVNENNIKSNGSLESIIANECSSQSKNISFSNPKKVENSLSNNKLTNDEESKSGGNPLLQPIFVGSVNDSRGWDCPNLGYVIIMGCPQSPADYLHMAGRVGRSGKSGTTITLIESQKELERLTSIFSMLSITENTGPLQLSL